MLSFNVITDTTTARTKAKVMAYLKDGVAKGWEPADITQYSPTEWWVTWKQPDPVPSAPTMRIAASDEIVI